MCQAGNLQQKGASDSWSYHTLCKERGQMARCGLATRLISPPRKSVQNDFLLPWEQPTWSIACPGSCKACSNAQQCVTVISCHDFPCKYLEKSINTERAITQHIIKWIIYSLTSDVILSCQNRIACPLSLSFERKVTNKNPSCCCLPKRKYPCKKNCNKETPQTLCYFFQNDEEI